MLMLGQQTARTCQTLDRRSFVQIGGSTVLGLTLSQLLQALYFHHQSKSGHQS
jgi:hypothetical protein